MAGAAPRFHGEPPLYLTSRLLGDAGLPHVFTTRHFPGLESGRPTPSPFDGAARALLAGAGLDGQPPAFLSQVHGAQVAMVERGGPGGKADILVTERAGLPLAIFTADCLPIVLYDARRRRLAVAHAGWRGTVEAAAQAALRALLAGGGRPADVLAAIGPSIGPCCYQVDGPVVERLEPAFPTAARAWLTPAGPGKWMLDLWRANEDQLVAAGLDASRIDNPRLCTACRPDLFFSHRRGRGEGRLAAVAAVPTGPARAC
jgi:hypothetical protein